MSKYVTVKELKQHSYIESNDEDDYIQSLLDAAESHVQKEIQCPLTDYVDEAGVLTSDLKHAIIIYAATLYDNREAVSFGTPQPVPYSYRNLIVPYIKFT
jgi:uncharacterized phage protein (predicted DNA packaging)